MFQSPLRVMAVTSCRSFWAQSQSCLTDIENMEKESAASYQPLCSLSHELINKLSVIVGLFDLEQQKANSDIELANHLQTIHDIAFAAAECLIEAGSCRSW